MNKEMICANCGIRKKKSNGISKTKKNCGGTAYKPNCSFCIKNPNIGDKAKQVHCRVCMKEYHPSQLDCDHVDGNRKNTKPENYQIICSNCHRLKTYMCKDSMNKEYK